MQMDDSSLQNPWLDNAFHNIRHAYDMLRRIEKNGQVTPRPGGDFKAGGGGGLMPTPYVPFLETSDHFESETFFKRSCRKRKNSSACSAKVESDHPSTLSLVKARSEGRQSAKGTPQRPSSCSPPTQTQSRPCLGRQGSPPSTPPTLGPLLPRAPAASHCQASAFWAK